MLFFYLIYTARMRIHELLENINYSNFTHRIEKLKCSGGPSPLFPDDNLRTLRDHEVEQLMTQGNLCADWSRVLVSSDFISDHIWHNHFIADVVLGRFDGSLMDDRGGSGSLPSGVFRSTIEHSHISGGCAVHNCPRIYGTLIVRDVLISNSNTGLRLPENGGIHYGNGRSIPIGIETGGREIALYSDLSLELAEYVLSNPGKNPIQDEYLLHLQQYLERIEFNWTIIDKHSRILDSKSIVNSYIGAYSRILGADEICDSSIFSTREDPTVVSNSSIVRNAIVQDGVHISDASIIQNSMLFEHSHAEHHGKIVDSIIGPNSGVSKGEITSCFLGPFVGFHHQSLLIAAFWPGGRGNVGYGANVGSNHTSRMPDQECWPGEGMFFGLSCAVKYPANFREAPYSIIAAGVTTLPQRLRFPFSLINEPVGYYLEVPPGFNNLIPAWGLYNNFYSLKRNEAKYRSRNRAQRNSFDLRLFRPEILDYMQIAADLLRNPQERKTIYLPGDIPGIGKNMLTDENRLKAVEAYDYFLRYAALAASRDSLKRLSTAQLEGLSDSERKTRSGEIQDFMAMLPELLRRTESSRERDLSRGEAIIPDYRLTHPALDEDSFILQVRRDTEIELAECSRLLGLLERG